MSLLADVYHERTNFDFVGNTRKWFAFSGVVIAIGVISLFINGLTFGIDFEGGTAWQVQMAPGRSLNLQDARNTLKPFDLEGSKVLSLRGESRPSIRVQAGTQSIEQQEKVAAALAKYAGTKPAEVSITQVGPTWGDQVSKKALRALIFFFLAIAIYLTWRFEWKMAVSAIVAVLHDIVITVGIYSLFRFEVVPATVIAFLTILGFSLYDTVVVFDKIDENTAGIGGPGRETYGAMVNKSMNEVLMRSLNTSFVALLPVASLLFVGSFLLGALTLRDFALALFVGLITGAYSSIFVATPVLAIWKSSEPKNRALSERAANLADREVIETANKGDLERSTAVSGSAVSGTSNTAAKGSKSTHGRPGGTGVSRKRPRR